MKAFLAKAMENDQLDEPELHGLTTLTILDRIAWTLPRRNKGSDKRS